MAEGGTGQCWGWGWRPPGSSCHSWGLQCGAEVVPGWVLGVVLSRGERTRWLQAGFGLCRDVLGRCRARFSWAVP